ncbi:MAG: hypothetical protein EXR07_07800 [Acetobacteraceae bacterium]|nr:hypothetical protein [Acetobacteraceae bacterium]
MAICLRQAGIADFLLPERAADVGGTWRDSNPTEIDLDVAARFNKRLDRWMKRTVWLTGCRSWYLDVAGRNTTLRPGFSFGYWLRLKLTPARVWRAKH